MDDLSDYYSTGRTKSRLLQALKLIGECRYAALEQLQAVKKTYRQHIFTKKSVNTLVGREFLEITSSQAYHLTDKSLEYLKINGINTSLFLKKWRATPDIHTSKITDYIISLQDDSDFFTVFYPQFKRPSNYTEVF